MLTILASYAQKESLSASENQKWRVRRNFEEGKPWNCTMLGYRQVNGYPVIVPEAAELVRGIFRDYLSGMGFEAITKKLNESGGLSRMETPWSCHAIQEILKNPTCTGDLLLQRKYRENHLSKKTLPNRGELPMYSVKDSHGAIVDRTTFDAVQVEMAHRAEKYAHTPLIPQTYPFTGILTCGICGKHYRRKATATGPVWICATYNTLGKAACPSKQIPEETLMRLAVEAFGMAQFDADVFHDKITAVTAVPNNTVVFQCKDGTEIVKWWQDRSRRESWTQEMRESARQKALERNGQK